MMRTRILSQYLSVYLKMVLEEDAAFEIKIGLLQREKQIKLNSQI